MEAGDMMKNSSKASHRPDSLTGAIAAFEGINDACTLLNGPLGCKVYVSYMASLLAPRFNISKSDCFSPFYFGQSRVPCTYVDEQDFVYGTETKVTQALKLLDSKKYNLIGVVNHSGTSLIGDDLSRIIQSSKIKTRTVPIESSGFTGTYASGFQNAVIKILECLTRKTAKRISKSVNIIGDSIFHYNWENDIAEIKRMLELLGVKVLSVICAGESVSNLEEAAQAELNVVLNEEYGDAISAYMAKELDIPGIGLDIDAPYGLSASEKWFKAVADFFRLPHENVTNESLRVRKKCYPALQRVTALADNLRGMPFGVFGDSSQVGAILKFLHQYLGMYPVIVGIKELGVNSYGSLKNYLAENSLDTNVLVNPDQYELIDHLNQTKPNLVLGSAVEENISLMLNQPPQFLPITFPYYEKVILINRPLIGFNGALTLVEDVLNSLKSIERNKAMHKN
jgi:light-independent protochlorophyllide reductase B subunit